MGYLECINEVGRFLGSLEIEDIDLRTKIIEHLANCVAGARLDQAETDIVSSSGISQTPILIRPRPEKPGSILTNGGDSCLSVSNSNSVINLTIPQASKATTISLGGVNFSLANENAHVINSSTSSPYRTSGLQIPNSVQSGHITNSKLAEVSKESQSFTDEKQRLPILNPNKYRVCDIQSKPVLMTQTETNINLIGASSATAISPGNSNQIFGGLQVLPTQLPSGEIVYIVPTNIFPTCQSTNYVIPVLSPNTLTSSAPTQTPMLQPIVTSDSNGPSMYGLKPMSLKSVVPISSQSENASFQISGSKTVIATCADVSPPLQIACDTKPRDFVNLNQSELFSTSQNIFLSSPAAHSVSQTLIPTNYSSIDLSVANSRTNDPAAPKKTYLYSYPTTEPMVSKSISYQNRTNDAPTEFIVPRLVSSTNGETHQRDINSPQHLVLNLAMQNRTRADESHMQSNFPEEDENVWRPW